jgi:hypothetical protein
MTSVDGDEYVGKTIADQSSRGELLLELIFIPGEHAPETKAPTPTTPKGIHPQMNQ